MSTFVTIFSLILIFFPYEQLYELMIFQHSSGEKYYEQLLCKYIKLGKEHLGNTGSIGKDH